MRESKHGSDESDPSGCAKCERLVAINADLLEACHVALGALIVVKDDHSWAGEIIDAITAAIIKAKGGAL